MLGQYLELGSVQVAGGVGRFEGLRDRAGMEMVRWGLGMKVDLTVLQVWRKLGCRELELREESVG